MKIGNPDNKATLIPVSGERLDANGKAAAAQPAPATPAAGAAEPSATVELSVSAAARNAAGSGAVFDTAKVERIAQAIRDGSYRIDAEAIADKLIANAAEVLGRVKH